MTSLERERMLQEYENLYLMKGATMTHEKPNATESLGALVLGSESDVQKLLPHCQTFNDVLQLCTWVSQSNIVPEAYRGKPADVFVAASYGQEIGLPFMTSVQKVAVIGGRPALPSDIKLAMVRAKKLLKHHKEAEIDAIKTTGIAWCEMQRVDVAESVRHTFTIDDAKQAGLWERRGANNYPTPWVLYKHRMLQLKARDLCLRDLFGDVFFGMASVEEAREVEWHEAQAQPEAQLAQASQPATKGTSILAGEKPPLEPQSPNDPPPAPVDPEPDETGDLPLEDLPPKKKK